MSTLIPDFARAMSEANRQTTASLEEEIRRVERLRERVEQQSALKEEWETLRRRVAREARAGNRRIIEEAREIGDLWASAILRLREGVAAEVQLSILRETAELAGSGRDLLATVRHQWALVEQMGGEVEGVAERAEAARLFERVGSEAARALAHRTTPWRPSDPARFERGRREAAEGKAVGPDEARARFRGGRGHG